MPRQNVIKLFMSLELIFLGAGLQFSMISLYLNDVTGQIFTLYILVIAACEVAIGLALFIVLARKHKTVTLSVPTKVKLKF
jgi:NADH-quinone oxidoreductase subunit K